MAESPAIKFGILGCADISRKLSRTILRSPNSVLHAIGSRSLDKAAKFALDNEFPDSVEVYGSYDAVLDDPDVDVAYIPLPTSLHVKWAVAAAHKKKHVLLEKPVALNVAELDAILEACESNGVQFMDGTMWMHHPRTAAMEQFLSDSKQFGKIKFVNTIDTFAASKDFLEGDIRAKPDLDGLGALGDEGWYCTRAILWATGYHLPKTVTALQGTVFNPAGVIVACGASMEWGDGKMATFQCSFMANLTQDITVVGTNGVLHVHDFILPYEEGKASFSTAVQPGGEVVVATELPQEVLMVRELSKLVTAIKFQGAKPEKKWPEIARKTQLVIDAVKLSIDGGCRSVEVGN